MQSEINMTPKLEELILGADLTFVRGDLSQTVKAIHFDSRQVDAQSVFVAILGLRSDGHQYIPQAIEQGARAIVCETLPQELKEGVTYLLATNSAQALGKMAANFYGNPSRQLKVVGVTGTNGKTSSVTLLFRLFQKLGYTCGLLSTVQNQIGEEIIPAQYTTPDALATQSLLAQMVRKGCTHCFMEVSSHALVQERTAGIEFTGAVFTNITHDHLDYHGTFQEYIKAKKKFFDELKPSAFALVNIDDKRGMVMLQNCDARTQKTFGLKNMADFKTKIKENTPHGLLLELDRQEIWFRLVGDFNAYNLLGVYGAATLLGESPEAVLTELSALGPVPGRFEQIASANQILAIVDYAHTPDSLENVLRTLTDIRSEGQNIITVVGCGGDRDKAKRPMMAQIAVEYSQMVFLTSDNPRSEPPMQIIEEMWQGLSMTTQRKARKIENRREAIQTACQIAQAGDIILVAGKGHEPYQEIQGVRYPFDDREVLKEFLST